MVETPPFLSDAASAGVTEDERARTVDLLAANPTLGDLIIGTGGARKVRFAPPGRGKSGGYRIITFFAEPAMSVFPLALFRKGDRANLSKAECTRSRY